MTDDNIKKKLENQIKVLKMKLKKAELEQQEIYTEAFLQGFDEGRVYQINEIELEMYQVDGEPN